MNEETEELLDEEPDDGFSDEAESVVSVPNNDKRKKIAVAITVNAVLLVFIIVVVIIAQIIKIGVLNRRKDELYEEYYRLTQELEDMNELELKLQNDSELYGIVQEYYKLTGTFPWGDK